MESQKECTSLEKKYESAWNKYSKEELEKVFDLSERYRGFISKCKTERECVNELAALAQQYGYKNIEAVMADGDSLKPGDKIYVNYKGKAFMMFIIGTEPMEKGLKILGSHIDSPRLDLKQNPLYEDTDLAMLKTHYYGGIKKYQWATLPLAIHGVFVKKDGTIVNVEIGEDENDPVVGVSDLLVHLSQEQLEKKASLVIDGEDMNICIGTIPVQDKTAERRVKINILNILFEKYGVTEVDFASAELEIVPSGKARDYGLDRSMVMGYGQDDRACVYTSFEAMVKTNNPKITCVAIFVDKEEIGSMGATSMESRFFENYVAEVMNLCGEYSELKLKRALANSSMLSSDVCGAFDPNYPSAMDRRNSAKLSNGLVFIKYTGIKGKYQCNDANPEFIAELRGIMDKHDVCWQTAELGKTDLGGGGTIAYILAVYGMEVIDCGIPLLNIHSPWEIACKADIYEVTKGYCAFLIEE